MQIVFSDQPLPTKFKKSLFLAGPSPRNHFQTNWRKQAVTILESLNFDGVVFVPIPENVFYNKSAFSVEYNAQVEWEKKARKQSDAIMFWVDRDIASNQFGLTTNVEFGQDLQTGKCWYGRPDESDNNRYLDNLAIDNNLKIYNDLGVQLEEVTGWLDKNQQYRENGEVNVPLFIWNTSQFQSWYSQLKQNGNELCDATVQHFLKFKNGFVFSFILHVNVWVGSEQRNKSNEFIFSRNDISVICPFYRGENETFIVLIKEFRSPVRNSKGLVYELPGGSSMKPGVDPVENAQHELHEETGIFIQDLSRFKFVQSNQLCSTLSTHKSWVYSVELNAKEFIGVLKTAKEKTTFGVVEDTEQTQIEIMPLSKIKEYPIDFSMTGMIYQSIT